MPILNLDPYLDLVQNKVPKTIVLVQCVPGTGEGWTSWGVGLFKLAVLQQENAYVHIWLFDLEEKQNLVHVIYKWVESRHGSTGISKAWNKITFQCGYPE